MDLLCYQTQLFGLKCAGYRSMFCRLSSLHLGSSSLSVSKLLKCLLARKVYICIIIVPGGLCSGDNRTVANASHLCSPEYSPHITQLLVEFFVVKHHLRDGVLFLLEQL